MLRVGNNDTSDNAIHSSGATKIDYVGGRPGDVTSAYPNDAYAAISRRVRACDYLVVAQLFLRDNFLLKKPLTADDIKSRLLGHWGTCHGINTVYANLKYFFNHLKSSPNDNHTQQLGDYHNRSKDIKNEAVNCNNIKPENVHFILGPGHGFPALQANLYLDGDLEKVDPRATLDESGLAHLCKSFSWPGGYPSHASPATPGVICEGGELGYALATAYGAALGCPDQVYCVLIGDGEFETATALASLNLNHLLSSPTNGRVLPILHLNGYKISAPTLAARRSERELHQLLRGFGYDPIEIKDGDPASFQAALKKLFEPWRVVSPNERSRAGEELGGSRVTRLEGPPDNFRASENFRGGSRGRTREPQQNPFIIFRSEKGSTGPTELNGKKVAGNYLSHQIPLPHAKTDPAELQLLEDWLKSYHFNELGVIK